MIMHFKISVGIPKEIVNEAAAAGNKLIKIGQPPPAGLRAKLGQ